MITVSHKFSCYTPYQDAETLIIGTFNPLAKGNEATFFYSRSRNYLWKILSTSYREYDLKGAEKHIKEEFCNKNKIAFVDLIKQIQVEEGQETNYADEYLDKQKIIWNNVIETINELKKLKRICFTRSTFSKIPNIKNQIMEVEKYCNEKQLIFKTLITPARYYNQKKQDIWNAFLHSV